MNRFLGTNIFLTPKIIGIILAFVLQISFILSPPLSVSKEKGYRIGAGDIINITIYAGGEKQHETDLTVSSNGLINAPFIGSIKAKGLTTNELQKKIYTSLAKDYFVNPEIDIYIKEYHSLNYYISGAVNSPGLYTTKTEATLLELIAKAGGTSPGRGKLAYIMRSPSDEDRNEINTDNSIPANEPIKIDLQRLLDQGDLSVNLTLEPGDVVYIPLKISLNLAESKIYVEGEVKKPGIYDYQPGMTAMSASILAGGFTPYAAPNRAKIIRDNGEKIEIIKINLNRIQQGKIRDFPLLPGDRIHIPETWL